MKRSPYFLTLGGLVFLTAAFLIPQWIYSKNPLLFMMNGELDSEQISIVADHISKNYVEPLERKDLMRNAVRGMTEHLDPWTMYIEPESAEKRDIDELKGDFVGIGVYLQPAGKTDGIVVTKVFEGGPADKAGVREGDVFFTVENIDVSKNKNTSKLTKLVKGKEGTIVTIKFFRPLVSDYVTLKITRGTVDIPSVIAEVKEGQVLYLKLNVFHAKSAQQMKQKLEEHPEVKAIVLDLRRNGGGLLGTAVEIASYFFPKNTLVVTVESREKKEQKFTEKDGKWKNLPMAVLIDKYSASASEILVGALQDHKRALVWGEKSYGKALVQRVYPLENGASGLRLTTGRYRTPKGTFLHRTLEKPYGIVPDKEIAFDSIPNASYEEILKGYWKKLEIKKDFQEFLKENPIHRRDPATYDALMNAALEDLQQKIK